jgi:2-keto-4-pentenoate hydratase/2-oxohepta-3-ene-1,7-dioic acid hydratase in catechol pathway
MKINKICRFKTNESAAQYGLVEENIVRPFKIESTLTAKLSKETINHLLLSDAAPIPFSQIKILPPTIPSKIVCVGRNYQEHAKELGNKMPDEPLLFLKAPSAIISTEEEIILPSLSNHVEHEGEIGVVIGRKAFQLSADENPLDYVLGYTCVNDITARDIQRKDVQFTRGKSFDTFCPVGPFIAIGLDPSNLNVTTRVNSVVKQQGNTMDMAFPVAAIIRYVAQVMTLFPGDLIATGTPAGVSALKDGDIVEVEVDGVGILRNPVKKQT